MCVKTSYFAWLPCYVPVQYSMITCGAKIMYQNLVSPLHQKWEILNAARCWGQLLYRLRLYILIFHWYLNLNHIQLYSTLTLSCRTTYIYIYIYIYICRTAPLTSGCCILYIIQQIYVQNILNMLHSLHFFFSSKCHLFHNATFFGSCVIHILYTGCAKI